MAPTLSPRETFRETVALVAAQARAKLPTQVNGRIESAVKLVLAHDVVFHDDGTVEVGSASDPMKTYTLAGSACDCQDFAYGKAPEGWCQHRIAAGIAKRVGEMLPQSPTVETEPTAPPASPAPTPAPSKEARCSVHVRLSVHGHDVQVTLRGEEETDVMERLHAVLAQYPAPAKPATPAAPHADAPPQCPTHGALKRSTKGKGWHCPHKNDDDTWCPSKGR